MLPFSAVWIGLWIALAGQQPGQLNPSPVKTVTEQPFYVAGYAVRTNNAREAGGYSEIGQLWRRFVEEKAAEKIPDRADTRTLAVYADYDTDEKGDYDYLLGARVTSVAHLPAGMTYRMIVPGTYAILTTERGPLTQVLQALWRKIWAMQPAELGGKRAFLTDYEIYDERSVNPMQAQVEIHIGLKPNNP